MRQQAGIITTMTMAFGGIFLLVLGGLFGFIMLQNKLSVQKVAFEEALGAAEAGIEYYKWHLSHFSDDLMDGTGLPGPYEHAYLDDEGKVTGGFSLTIEGQNYCGEVGAVTITSTGWTEQFPDTQRKVQVTYVRPSVAEFAYLLDANVWAGADREIKGPYHSNGGIRMDGENQSIVSSAKETWMCTESFGCDPPQEKPGVFTTANGNEDLFSYPVTPFDFAGITVDLASLKNIAQPEPEGQGLGLYFPPVSHGYYLEFQRTVLDVYEITDLNPVYAYSTEEGWHWEDSLIGATSFIGSFPIPSACGVIFVEDDIWVQGEIEGKVTLVTADLTDPGTETSAWLLGDIEYREKDGSDGLVLLSQKDVSITLNSPDSMELQGIFIAQTGRFGRNHYDCSDYPADCIKSDLEVYGSIVSDGRVGTKWSYTWGGIASGYMSRENIYDSNLGSSPPPFLPVTSPDLELRDWEEVE